MHSGASSQPTGILQYACCQSAEKPERPADGLCVVHAVAPQCVCSSEAPHRPVHPMGTKGNPTMLATSICSSPDLHLRPGRFPRFSRQWRPVNQCYITFRTEPTPNQTNDTCFSFDARLSLDARLSFSCTSPIRINWDTKQ